MVIQQAELALIENSTPPIPRSFEEELTIRLESFNLAISLDDLELAIAKGALGGIPVATAVCSVLDRIRSAARYRIKKTVDRGKRKVECTLALDRIEDRWESGRLRRTLLVPRRTSKIVEQILAENGVRAKFSNNQTPPPADLDTVAAPFKDGRSLDPAQQQELRAHLSCGHSTIVDVAMAGGKSLLIAGLIRGNRELRPALVTGLLSTDTAQLAINLAQLTGEKVALLGCAGALSREVRAQYIEKDWKKATILVGTHALLRKVDPVILAGDNPAESSTKKAPKSLLLKEAIQRAPLVIADEVDGLTTQKMIGHLLAMQPTLFYGATGTWGRRSDKVDRVFEELLVTGNETVTPGRITHGDLVRLGRVAPVELLGYVFNENRFKKYRCAENRAYTLVQQEIIQRGDRNRFLGELLSHLLAKNRIERRGAIMVFVKTIEHGYRLLWNLAKVEDIEPTQADLLQYRIALHHAEMSTEAKLANIEGLRTGAVRLIVTTDTLATGFDCAQVSDLVDATGMQEIWKTLQRSGRPIRPATNKVSARIHLVHDVHHPALIGIGRRKQAALESYFSRPMSVFADEKLPWLRDVKRQREQEKLEADLTRAGF